MSDKTSRYLTFTLADEDYAVSVSRVKEVLDKVAIRKVPKMPIFMTGVLNLRGSVVPVINLRLKFGLEALDEEAKSNIIILEINQDKDLSFMGVFVDAVHEVIDLDSATIESAPNIGTSVDSSFIEGMCEYKDGFLILLDIEKVLKSSEILQINQHAGEAVEIGEINESSPENSVVSTKETETTS